jgi:hypothetical protein
VNAIQRRRIVTLRGQAARFRECVRRDCFTASVRLAHGVDVSEHVLDVEACLVEAVENDERADALRALSVPVRVVGEVRN